MGGLRGVRVKARGPSGAREGTEKLEPNQHGVELLRPNLQVTPRGGGGGGSRSGGDQSRQLLRAPPGGGEASLVNRHRHPSAQLGGPGPWEKWESRDAVSSLAPKDRAGWAGGTRECRRAERCCLLSRCP